RVGYIVIPLVAVVLPGDVGGDERVANAGRGRRRNGEYRVRGIGIRECVVAVSEVSRIVVVQQVIMTGVAVRADRTRKRLKIADDGSDSRLSGVGAVGVRTSARRGGAK